MKPGIHPDYHPVVFQDADTGAAFLIRSTITSSRTIDRPTADRVRTYPSSWSRFPLRHIRSGLDPNATATPRAR
jgi:Ribosomal protein L31